METIKLKKAINFEGVEVSELAMDLDGLTGQDLINAANFAAVPMGEVVEMNAGYVAQVAAMSAGKPVELILALGAKDFTQVKYAVQSFLMGE